MQINVYFFTLGQGLKVFTEKLFPPKPFILNRYAISTLLCLFFTLFFCVASAQELTSKSPTTTSNVEKSADVDLLKKAKSLALTDTSTSIKLANEVLRLSEKNNNFYMGAQAHSLLGELAQQSKNIEQASHHFLQASFTYKNNNDKRNQVISSIHYIELLLDAKLYEQANIAIEELIPVALDHKDKLLIALTLIIKGDLLYKQKNFDRAVVQYHEAIKYLSGYDEAIQNRLGDTYKKLAQSYKRLKNREKTAYFYKKTLAVYTNLDNKKLMARTLNTLAEAERYLGNLVTALEYAIQGLKLHEQLDDPIGCNKAFMGVGIIYRHIGRYEKSLHNVYKAHLYYKKTQDNSGIAKSSNQLGFIYTRLKEFDQARSFYQLTIDLADKKIDSNTLASALREIAVIDLNAGNYNSAMLMAKKAYKVYLVENDKSKASLTARIIANIYRDKEDNTNAINFYRESLKLAKEIGSKIYQIKAQTALARILIGKDIDEAVSLLQKSVNLSTQMNDKPQALYAYRNLLLAEKSRGNFKEALQYAEEEIALTQMIQKENDDNEFILAKANLHSHKLEIELESLREKTKFDQVELTKKNSEIEITEQARIITELELIKNKYASIALALLLSVCVILIVFIFRRFNASKKHNKELNLLAARDPLTNCYNRRILFNHMNLDFTDPELLEEYCIILADIDLFKNVNDTYGHSAGDSVLIGVANILQSCVRQNDIVARFGGEEFCIILHQVNKLQALTLADTMRKKIEKSLFDDIHVTCSFGVSSIEFNAKSPTELIDQADLALYKSKSLGRNQITLWESTFTNKTNILEKN